MFPEYRDLITRLKSEGTHQRFLHLFERHNQLDHQIANMGTQDAGTMHAAIEALKKEKLHVGRVYALLRQEAAAAG
jgi:uncharacterized protein YdcH (DUF465 family)